MRENLIGKKFGRLTVIKYFKDCKRICKCDCGNYKVAIGADLKRGNIQSCGCLQKELTGKRFTKHGMRGARFYSIWCAVKDRCSNINSHSFRWYGARGISVCERWGKFENFRDDMYENYLKHVKRFGEKQTTIDRIDNDGNYCKENCRWATHKQQTSNRRINRDVNGIFRNI